MDDMIPKIAHFIWVKNQPMSFMRYTTLWSFRKTNPDWIMKIHLVSMDLLKGKTWEEDMGSDYLTPFNGKNYYDQLWKLNNFGSKDTGPIKITYDNTTFNNITEPAAMSDILAWYLLATEGGVYFDMDILFIESLNPLHNTCNNVDSVITYGHSAPTCTDDYFSIGVMMSSGNNQMFKVIMQLAEENYCNSGYQSAGIKILEKYYHDLDGLENAFPKQKIGLLPMIAFYALDWRMLDGIFCHNMIPYLKNVGAYGIHWYGGSNIAQEYISKINEYNYRAESGTLFQFMAGILS